MSASEARKKIIEIYKKKVHEKKPDITKMSKTHDGKKGHWLEDMMGSKRDASNTPDLLGYEMKTGNNKTTFGDWGPDYFIFRDKEKFPNLIGKEGKECHRLEQTNKDAIFLKAFGTWRETTNKDWVKNGYYSWSGKPSPSRLTDGFNIFGQAFIVNDDNSISIIYSYSKDERVNKSELVPLKFQIENLRLFGWNEKWINDKVENKFSVHGWFKCIAKKDIFCEIIFGEPISIQNFLGWIKNGDVIFDTGMKERRPDGTDRFRNQWRASSKFWKSLAVETYPKS